MSVYAFSDLHAQYDLWDQIKNYIKPNDIVYCLGDCVDRGSIGLNILNEVIKTPNIILLKGNHEDFIDSIGSETLQYSDNNIDLKVLNMYLWRINGAENTIKDFQKMTKEKRKKLINQIRKLPTHAEYINKNGDIIYLCHAGRQPDTKEIHDMREGDIPMNNYIWDRRHIFDKTWRGKNNEYCIHGHSPVQLFESKLSIRDFSNVSDPEILDEKSNDIKTIKLIKGDIDRTRVIESLYMNNFKEYEYQVLIYYINKNNISYKQGLNEICGPFILLKEKLKISFSQIYKIFVCFIDKFLTNYFS